MGILSWPLRVILFLGSVTVFAAISRCVRKRRIQLRDGIYWILCSLLLILISVFPILAVWAARLLGIQSASNCVFLIIIFLLGFHQFFLTLRMSQLEMKLNRLVQSVAIQKTLIDEGKETNEENLLLFR